MDILIIGCVIALIVFGGGSLFAYILGIKDDLKWGLRENERLEHDVDWWQDYCDTLVEQHKEALNEHEERLKKLQERVKELEKEVDIKNDEIILLEREVLELKAENGTINVETRVVENLREIREATKDLDFPPVGKIEEDPTDFWPTDIIKPDAINKFLNRQSKNEDENNG